MEHQQISEKTSPENGSPKHESSSQAASSSGPQFEVIVASPPRRSQSRSPKRSPKASPQQQQASPSAPASSGGRRRSSTARSPSPKRPSPSPAASIPLSTSPKPTSEPQLQSPGLVAPELDRSFPEPKLEEVSGLEDLVGKDSGERAAPSANTEQATTTTSLPSLDRAASAKRQRAEASMARLEAARSARALLNSTKNAPIDTMRSPVRRKPDFDKIHSKAFQQMASIGEKSKPAVAPATASKPAATTPKPRPDPVKLTSAKSITAVKTSSAKKANREAAPPTGTSARPTPSVPASVTKPGILMKKPQVPSLRKPAAAVPKPTKASVMAAAAAEARRKEKEVENSGPAPTILTQLLGKPKSEAPTAPMLRPAPENKPPAEKVKTGTKTKAFDLKASLARPVTWQAHTGKLPTAPSIPL